MAGGREMRRDCFGALVPNLACVASIVASREGALEITRVLATSR